MMKKAVIVLSILFLVGLGTACQSSSSEFAANRVSETHLQEALINSFNLQWFEDCCRFQDMVKKIAESSSGDKRSADYLLGYIDCDTKAQPRYIKIIYTSQKGLNEPVLPQELNSRFADFFNAKAAYQRNLKKVLQEKGQFPTDRSFQQNTETLVSLSDSLFVKTKDIGKGDSLTKFQTTLKKATECFDAAFPDSTSK
ncbi:hypothetical protein A7X67_05955 [Clostridium sp. W14A]|nr:hypothetical protein A7X67_05955 [Clostridium sp. W14A]